MFYAAVLNMLQLAAEVCTSTILIIFLVVTDPIITLGVALAMVLMVLLFMKKLKRTLARLGDERRNTMRTLFSVCSRHSAESRRSRLKP